MFFARKKELKIIFLRKKKEDLNKGLTEQQIILENYLSMY